MQEVPAGNTVSFKKLREMNGDMGSKREIATALRTNPVALLIPCHRVLREVGGTIGRYLGGGGARVKDWLIRHEKEGLAATKEELKTRRADMDTLEAELDVHRAELDVIVGELDDGRGYMLGRRLRHRGRPLVSQRTPLDTQRPNYVDLEAELHAQRQISLF